MKADMKNRRKRKENKYRRLKRKYLYFLTGICGLMVLFTLGMLTQMKKQKVKIQKKQIVEQRATKIPFEKENEDKDNLETKEPQATVTPNPTPDPTEEIYTYLQGPKSWNQRLEWSGPWAEKYVDGGYFGGFGCGICCLANIYSSLTSHHKTPWEMYAYTKKHTGYSGGMAVSWGYMKRALQSMDMEVRIQKKTSHYAIFQKEIEKSKAAVVLVSSADSRVYWKNTPGHYVTIFLYDKEKDRVFLADSGDPVHNRNWVSLKKIYRSLKTASDWQYITVYRYKKK